MPWESEASATKPGRDWARIMWIAVAVLIAGGVAMLFIPRGRDSSVTEARVKHILIKLESGDAEKAQAAFDTITSIRQRILSGESFSKLAQESSEDTWSGPRGGDLGWVRRGTLTDEIDNLIWILPVGQVSEIVISGQGLHLVLVTERNFSDAERYERELKERVLEDSSAPDAGTP